MLEPCAGSHIERSRVRPIGRRRRSVQAPAHTTRHDRSSRARGNAPRSGSAGQSSRDSLAPIIPQRVSARTEAARRSGTRRARGFGGRGAPAWACKVTRTSGFAWYLRGGGRGSGGLFGLARLLGRVALHGIYFLRYVCAEGIMRKACITSNFGVLHAFFMIPKADKQCPNLSPLSDHCVPCFVNAMSVGFASQSRGCNGSEWGRFCACGRHCSVISGWWSGLVVDEASICLTCVDHPTSRQSITESVVIGAEC